MDSKSEMPTPAVSRVLQPVVPSPGSRDFVAFESGPVRPMAKSPNGAKLFVTNTPDNRLEIFNIDVNGNLTSAGSVRVGLEPVAVAARSDSEVWVVNHLSDSVSIVDVASSPPRTAVRTARSSRRASSAAGRPIRGS